MKSADDPIEFIYDSPKRGKEKRRAVLKKFGFGRTPEHVIPHHYLEAFCMDRLATRFFPIEKCNFIKEEA